MDPDHLFLALACVASVPSASQMMRPAPSRHVSVEMAIGATICIAALGLLATDVRWPWIIAMLAGALATGMLKLRLALRWPLLLLATCIFALCLHRAGGITI